MLNTPWLIVLVWYPHVIYPLADSISVVPSWAGGILRLCAGERSLYGLLLNIKCSLGAEESSYPVVVLTPSPGRTSPPPPPTHTHRPLVNILSFSHKHTHTDVLTIHTHAYTLTAEGRGWWGCARVQGEPGEVRGHQGPADDAKDPQPRLLLHEVSPMGEEAEEEEEGETMPG